MAFAGLYELWRDAALPDDHPKAWLWTAAIITTRATDEVGWVHDRMPMVVKEDLWPDWLDPVPADADRLLKVMAPATADALETRPVSTAVNSVRNDGPDRGLLPCPEPVSQGRCDNPAPGPADRRRMLPWTLQSRVGVLRRCSTAWTGPSPCSGARARLGGRGRRTPWTPPTPERTCPRPTAPRPSWIRPSSSGARSWPL